MSRKSIAPVSIKAKMNRKDSEKNIFYRFVYKL